jgi:hypothetical protein
VSGANFVVYATRRALEQAQELGFPGVIESKVEAAILEGRQFKKIGARQRLVNVEGWIVRVTTGDRTPGGRRRLLVTRIETNAPRRTPR